MGLREMSESALTVVLVRHILIQRQLHALRVPRVSGQLVDAVAREDALHALPFDEDGEGAL